MMDAILVTVVIIFLVVLRLSRRADHIFPLISSRHGQVIEGVFTTLRDQQLNKQWYNYHPGTLGGSVDSSLGVVPEDCDLFKGSQIKKACGVLNVNLVFFDGTAFIHEEGETLSLNPTLNEQTCLALIIVSKFAIRKNILAKKIKQVITSYIDYLTAVTGKLADIQTMTNICTCNVIFYLLKGYVFENDSKELQNLTVYLNLTAQNQRNISLINHICWLKYSQVNEFLTKNITLDIQGVLTLLKCDAVKGRTDVVYRGVKNFISARLSKNNENLPPGVSVCVDCELLMKVTNQLFGAEIDDTKTAMYWRATQMITYCEIQDMVYREFKKHIRAFTPSYMQDINKLSCANLETMMTAGIVELDTAYPESITWGKYSVPRQSHENSDLDQVLFDKKIKETGSVTLKPGMILNAKLQDRKELIPCISGKRIAFGETKGKIELFMFFSNVFQRC